MTYQNSLLSISILSILLFGLTSSCGTVYSQDDVIDSKEPEFLSIQQAQSGLISEINATTYSLQLNDISDNTILFSDRPDRIVTSIRTDDFIGNWTLGADSFSVDAPNAALVVHEKEGQEVKIVELFNPVLDKENKTLKYEIRTGNATSISLDEFGLSTLVIDIGMSNAGTFA